VNSGCFVGRDEVLWRRTRLRNALRGLASLIHHWMSAFAVAIGGKADMAYCSANVRF
jgi:hypothetical protein